MKKIELRDYQLDAVRSVVSSLTRSPSVNPCVVVPTGGGKTPIITTLARYYAEKHKRRVLILSHRKELIEQTARTLSLFSSSCSIFSAGLGEKDVSGEIIIAGIQSAISSLDLFRAITPSVSIVIIDEAHLIPNLDDNNSSYQKLVTALKETNPALNVIGFTATPYRLDSGLLCSSDSILNKIVYEVKTADLIERGYLCPLTTRVDNLVLEGSTSNNAGEILRKAVANMLQATRDRNKVIIFSPSVKHCREVYDLLRERGESVEIVTGETPNEIRDETIKRFKTNPITNLIGETENPLKYLVNVDVLTTGFDAPNVDTVVLFRTTQSRALYVQMIGRGLRLAPTKKDCLVLDFGCNVKYFGALDDRDNNETIRVKTKRQDKELDDKLKTCPNCSANVPLDTERCGCGYLFDKVTCPNCGESCLVSLLHCSNCNELLVTVPHNAIFNESGILTLSEEELRNNIKTVAANVDRVSYEFKESSRSPLLVEYLYLDNGARLVNRFAFEYPGKFPNDYPKRKALKMWRDRTLAPPPVTSLQAYYYAISGRLAKPIKVRYKPRLSKEFFDNITKTEVEPLDYDKREIYNKTNPFNKVCPRCQCGKFVYIRRGSYYLVKCIYCNETVLSVKAEDLGASKLLYRLTAYGLKPLEIKKELIKWERGYIQGNS